MTRMLAAISLKAVDQKRAGASRRRGKTARAFPLLDLKPNAEKFIPAESRSEGSRCISLERAVELRLHFRPWKCGIYETCLKDTIA